MVGVVPLVNPGCAGPGLDHGAMALKTLPIQAQLLFIGVLFLGTLAINGLILAIGGVIVSSGALGLLIFWFSSSNGAQVVPGFANSMPLAAAQLVDGLGLGVFGITEVEVPAAHQGLQNPLPVQTQVRWSDQSPGQGLPGMEGH